MRWANFFHLYQPPRWPAAVISKVARESYRPLVRFLLSHAHVKVTLNISGSLTEQLATNPRHKEIITGVRRLLNRGQIELTDSAIYHAILPLLPVREITRQIQLNRRLNRRVFGRAYRPSGFFPPEMAYSAKLGKILNKLKYQWVILDGLSHPGIVNYQQRYRIRGTKMTAVFRNRYISDYLAFAIQAGDSRRFLSTVQRWNGQQEILVTAMDGENLGHHRRAAKRIWQTLVHQPHIQTIKVSELLKTLPNDLAITPRAASWSSQSQELRRGVPFGLWRHPNNELHLLQWQLFLLVQSLVERHERRGRLSSSLRAEFDRAVASDWYWWASREPWWDVAIVVGAAQNLHTLAEELNPPPLLRDRLRALVHKIATTARRWQETGEARRHAGEFLKSARVPRYLGGERVH
ncbi:MAG: hypothetical protein HY420_05230 [Candidatus Kerfeldbacteria bacterium]|nr:hypothetical protein [Candidatus Kerfeldbacteria bacterium]